MSKIVDVEIAGRKCRLNFSVASLFRLADRFGETGTLAAIWEGILPPEGELDIFSRRIYDNVLAVAAELMSAGAAYHKLMVGEDAPSYTAEELQVLLNSAEYVQLHAAVIKAIQAGLGRTVETAPDEEKKTIATQGN